MEAEGANVVRGVMWDRFAIDGRPRPVNPTTDLPARFPVRARFVRDVMEGTDIKGVIVKGHLASRGAHHLFEDERVASFELEISHFKWHGGALDRVRSAQRELTGADKHWADEYQRVLDHYAANGRFAWETFGGEVVGRGAHRHRPGSEFRVRSAGLTATSPGQRDAEVAAMARVLDSGELVLAGEVAAFEREWAEMCRVPSALGVGSGTDALEIGLRSLGLGYGDAVIVPAMTAFPTLLAVMRAGCEPIIADIDPATALLDPASAERCVRPNTRAVVLVHLYGRCADLPMWRDWAAERDLFLVEDVALSLIHI